MPGFMPAGDAAAANNAAQNAKQKKTTTYIIIAAAAALALIAIVVVVLLLFSGGYKQPINKAIGLANKQSSDVGAYLDCVAPSYVSTAYKDLLGCIKGGDAKKELDNAIKDGFEDIFDEFEDEYGKNWKISVEFKKATRLKKKDLKEIQESYEDLGEALEKAKLDDDDIWDKISDAVDDEYDSEINTDKAIKTVETLIDNLGKTKVTDGYDVKMKLSIKGKDDDEDTTVTVKVVKANGKWFIDPLSLGSEAGYSVSSLISMLSMLSYY